MKDMTEIIARIFVLSVIRYLVIAGIPFIVFYKWLHHWFSTSKIQQRQAAIADFKREIVHSLQTTLVLTIIAYLVMFTSFTKYTHVYNDISEYPLWWMPVSIGLSLMIHDTYFYWMHRLLHNKALFKYAHLLHHKSSNPSPWTSYSFHFFEAWVEGGVLVVIVLLVPMHLVSVILFTITSFAINVYGHLGYELAPRWFRQSFFFRILNTSVHHNMHHRKFKGNYGLYFRIWDRLMQTEHPDYVKEYDRIQQVRFGNKALDC